MTSERREIFACGGEREQEDRADRGPQKDKARRAELADSDLDEEVGDAPDETHGREEDPASPCHPITLAGDAPAVYRRRYIQARATASGARASGSRGRPSAGAAPASPEYASASRRRGGSHVRSSRAPD